MAPIVVLSYNIKILVPKFDLLRCQSSVVILSSLSPNNYVFETFADHLQRFEHNIYINLPVPH